MTVDRRPPPAAAVLRRALVLWGLGHLALGDRRGWALLVLQPLAIASLVGLAVVLLDTTRWIALFPVLALIVVVWLAQAIHAHRLALERGAEDGGEMQAAWALPVILAVLTIFWLLGGDRSSPAATLHEYVAAWHASRFQSAAQLFVEPPSVVALAADWQRQDDYIRERVAHAAAVFGTASGLDPDDPFTGLRYVELPIGDTPDSAVVAVDVVRRQRVETSLFGLIPTATQETVLVERAGLIRLRAVPASLPSWLRLGQREPRTWKIEEVLLPLELE